MPLRFLSRPREIAEAPKPSDPVPRGRSVWRTGLLLVSSAALGGIAVAIWNRRTLALMRQNEAPTAPLTADAVMEPEPEIVSNP